MGFYNLAWECLSVTAPPALPLNGVHVLLSLSRFARCAALHPMAASIEETQALVLDSRYLADLLGSHLETVLQYFFPHFSGR